MQHLVCESPSEFDVRLTEAEGLCKDGMQLYVYFAAAKDPSSGVSWCGDCVRAEPVVHSALSNIPEGCVFLEAPLQREEYRQADFVFRTDPRIQIKCVPTLFKWSNGRPVGRLNDSQCQQAQYVLDLIEA